MPALSRPSLSRLAATLTVIFASGSAPIVRADQPAPPPEPSKEPVKPPTPVPNDLSKPRAPEDVPFPPLVKKPELRNPIIWEGQRFSTFDWVLSGTAAGIALGANILPPLSSHWTGTNGFDDSARDFFRLGSENARYNARDISDVLLSIEVTWPFFVDALIGAWWYHDSPDAAKQMALVDIEAYAIASAMQGTTTLLTSRERPYGRDCGTPPLSMSSDCTSASVRDRSFFSGHASMSFLGASLTCVHHLKLDLFGSRTADIATCAVAYSTAAATAMLRTLGDVHYASDVLLGAAVGTAVGLGIPLLQYRKPKAGILHPETARADEGRIMFLPFGAGLGVGGTF